MTIQTTGSFEEISNIFSLSIAIENHAITLDGLTKEDLLEIQSCIDCLIDSEEFAS